MNSQQLSPCYVVVRKLTFDEISRISINPHLVTYRCGLCKQIARYGPKCLSCGVMYHYGCAGRRKSCCNETLVPGDSAQWVNCHKCEQTVKFGLHCQQCQVKFHAYCISPIEQCCQLNVCPLPPQQQCGACDSTVTFGPRCPFCNIIYHSDCAKKILQCCGVELTHDGNHIYKCKKCHKNVGLASVMCTICGNVRHAHCLKKSKNCCGKILPLEVYLIPSFKHMINYYTQFDKRRGALNKIKDLVISHTHRLRSSLVSTAAKEEERAQNVISNSIDQIAIVEVKTVLEDIENHILDTSSPLESETNYYSEPMSSSSVAHETPVDVRDTLKMFFDFLCEVVLKFPPELQTQVNNDMYKTIAEAEMNSKITQYRSP